MTEIHMARAAARRRYAMIAIWTPLAVFAALLIAQFSLLRLIPDPAAIHWEVAGRPDGFAARWTVPFVTVVPAIAVTLLVAGAPYVADAKPAMVRGGAMRYRLIVTSSAEWRGSSVASWRGQVTPMTRVLCAASMTSLVMVSSSLIFRTRWIWGKRRSRSRKLPRVIRAMAAMAWASVKSSGSRVLPRDRQCRSRTNSSSSCPRGRYWWAKPTRL